MAAGGGPFLSSLAPSAGCSCPEPSGTARTPSAIKRHTGEHGDSGNRTLFVQVKCIFAMFKRGGRVLEQQEQT